MKFFKTKSRDTKVSLKLVVLLLAKKLEFEHVTTEEYFRHNHAKVDIYYNEVTFSKIVAPLIGLEVS